MAFIDIALHARMFGVAVAKSTATKDKATPAASRATTLEDQLGANCGVKDATATGKYLSHASALTPNSSWRAWWQTAVTDMSLTARGGKQLQPLYSIGLLRLALPSLALNWFKNVCFCRQKTSTKLAPSRDLSTAAEGTCLKVQDCL